MPQAPTVVYSEDFQNSPATAPVLLPNYVGAGGEKYTSDPWWSDASQCNGLILNFTSTSNAACGNGNAQPTLRGIAQALGKFQGDPTPNHNNAVSAFTQVERTGPDNGIELTLTAPVPLPAARRFLTASLNVGAICYNNNIQVPMSFFLTSGGSAHPVTNGNEDICHTATAQTIGGYKVGTVTGNTSWLSDGADVNFIVRNDLRRAYADDHAYDDIKILDVTPQLDKSFSTPTIAGRSSTLTFTITNTKELASKNGWSFTDTLSTGLTVSGTAATNCPAGAVTASTGSTSIGVTGNLTAGMASCTVTVPVTSLVAGSFTNGASNITANGLNPPATTTGDFLPATPAIAVVKTANPTTVSQAGTPVTYSFRITNTGNVPLSNVVPIEGAFSGTGTMTAPLCPAGAASLAVGASVTCTATYTTTQADQDAGTITNTATATGAPPLPGDGPAPIAPPSTAVVTATQSPAITLAKTADPTAVTTAGSVITYSFLMTNTGNVTLDDAHPIEGAFSGTGLMSIPVCPVGAASLAPTASVTCTASYTVTAADLNTPMLTNTATATGTPPAGPAAVSTPADSSVMIPPTPSITLRKSANPSDAASFTVGRLITFSFVLTNTGNVTLTNAHPTEVTFTGTGPLSPITCPAGAASLAPAAQVICNATYTLTLADVNNPAGVTNTAIATGAPPTGPDATSPPDIIKIEVVQAPSLTVAKTASTHAITAAGAPITYSFLMTNTGNVTLTNVTPVEGTFTGHSTLAPIVCPAGASSMAPGAEVTCTATYTTSQADMDAGSIVNNATATGTPPVGPATDAPNSVDTISAEQLPALTLVKTITPTTASMPGTPTAYSFLITNTGNVTLADVKPVEAAFTGHGRLSALTCPAAAASLAPKTSVTCTADYTLTQADVDAGSVLNEATAHGTTPVGVPTISDNESATVTIAPTPKLTIVKTVTPSTAPAAGAAVTYSFLVTNTGNVTLTDVAPVEGVFTGHGLAPTVSCPNGPAVLAPAATVTCTAAYTLTQTDVDAGTVTNHATATGNPPTGPPTVSSDSTTTMTVTGKPALTIQKSASPPDAASFTLGRLITYSFVITNTGNVTLTDVAPVEKTFTGSGPLPASACPAAASSLAVGAQVTCTTTYTLTQPDIDAGTVTNTAVATGTPPTGNPITSPSASYEIPVAPMPAATLVKTADVPSTHVVGAVIVYYFKITNTGNVTLTDIHPTEGVFTGHGSLTTPVCPAAAATLVPGASVTCTAAYTVVAGDADTHSITNTATAVGTFGGNTTVITGPSTATVATAIPAPPVSAPTSTTPTVTAPSSTPTVTAPSSTPTATAPVSTPTATAPVSTPPGSAAPGPPLAATGVAAQQELLGALVLLTLGIAFVVASTRRRRS